MRNLETIIVLILLAFGFIPQRLHHSLTLPRSRLGDSASVTQTPGDDTTDRRKFVHHFLPINITTTWNAHPYGVVNSRTVNTFQEPPRYTIGRQSPRCAGNWYITTDFNNTQTQYSQLTTPQSKSSTAQTWQW